MTPETSVGGSFAVDLILDRINASDTLTRSLNEQLIERVEKVEQVQEEIKGRLDQLERKDEFRQGQMTIQTSARQGVFRIALVILAAFAAGFAGSLFENNITAIPPTHKQDVTLQTPFKEES